MKFNFKDLATINKIKTDAVLIHFPGSLGKKFLEEFKVFIKNNNIDDLDVDTVSYFKMKLKLVFLLIKISFNKAINILFNYFLNFFGIIKKFL